MIEQSATVGALAAALAAAAPGLREARKDRGNTHLRSRYATLEAILEAVREPLAAQGVAITQGTGSAAGGVVVSTQLTHSSGEWMRTSLMLPLVENKGLTAVQVLGSAITYGRRYTLSALCGLGAEERDDDDGEAERSAPRRGRAEHPAEREQRQAGHHESWTDAERGRFCAALRDLGLEYDAVAARLAAAGQPRPSAMSQEQRVAVVRRLRADAAPADAR